MTSSLSERSRTAITTRDVAVVVIGAALIVVSLCGFSWLFMPADPTAGTPGGSVSFNDLRAATEASPSAVQAAYFGWLAWAAFGVLIVLNVATPLIRSKVIAVAALAAGVVTAVITILALKGPQTWSQTIQALPNLRFGGYLMLIGLLTLLIFSAVKNAQRFKAGEE